MHSTYLPVWLWVLGSHQERCTQDRRPRPMVSVKAVRNQMVPSRAEWRGETDNRATPPVGCCPSTASFGHIARMPDETDARSIITASPSEDCAEETTRTSSNYVDEDYPARPEIKQSLTGWGDNCGAESSTLETDVCIWRYAPLVVHATQEEDSPPTQYWLLRATIFTGQKTQPTASEYWRNTYITQITEKIQ